MAAAATERAAAAAAAAADEPMMAVWSSLLLTIFPMPPRSCHHRRIAYFLAFQGAVIIWALFFVDFSWLQEPRKTAFTTTTTKTTQSSRGFWRIKPLSFSSSSSSSSGWISTNKTLVVAALSEDLKAKQQEPPKTISSSSINSNATNLPVDLQGVIPRAFLPWKNGTMTSLEDLCFPPEDKIMSMAVQRSPAKAGIFLNKLMKVGGSTAAGINIRIAMSIAQRYPNRTTISSSSNDSSNDSNTTISDTTAKTRFPLCRGRWDHSTATRMQYGQRDLDHSFLWTVVREPTKRAVSQFFHFQVSKNNISATSHGAFQAYLSYPPLFYNYYLNTLDTRLLASTPTSILTPQQLQQRLHENGRRLIVQQQRQNEDGPVQTIQNILHDHDFVGITERMAESAVALMMLLNLTIPDVLYANAKTSGGYDAMCNYIQPTNVTDQMQAFLNGPRWRKMVYWDSVLYRAANRSLNLTIESLNRHTNSHGVGAFDANLQEFLRIQALVQSQCIEGQEVFPCVSTTGQRNPKPDCLWIDSGCGHSCIKQVVQQLGL